MNLKSFAVNASTINAANENNTKAFLTATQDGNAEIVEILLSKGVNIEAVDKDGMTALHWAAGNGHEKVVEVLLSYGANIEAVDTAGSTALHLASEYGHEKVVEGLLSKGANMEAVDKTGNTALHRAAVYGHEKVVEGLLSKGANIEAVSTTTMITALHWAAGNGHEEVVEVLILKGANIEAVDTAGSTALHLAAGNGHEKVVEGLLSKGANMEAVDNAGFTALHLAAVYGHEKVVEGLLLKGANMEAADLYDGNTALHVAARNGHGNVVVVLLSKGVNIEAVDNDGSASLHGAAVYGHEKIVEGLLSKGANIKAVDKYGSTALHGAAENGHEKVVEVLLSNGANIQAFDRDGSTALHGAATNGHEKVVEVLLSKGANIKAVDKYGSTALHGAAENGSEEVVEVLLSNGANIQAVDNYGMTALHCAARNGHDKVVEGLLSKHANFEAVDRAGITALHLASANGHEKVVEGLLSKGANIEVVDNAGITSLHGAAVYGHEKIVEGLLSKGSFVEAFDISGYSALHRAARNGHKKVVKILLSKGANMEAVDKYGSTALHGAATNGSEEVVEVLLSNGANIKVVDENGCTALHRAAENGHEKVLEVLLSNGANIEAFDRDGFTALRGAATNGYDKIVEVLLSRGANIEAVDNYGMTALHCAARNGHDKVVEVLLSKGASISSYNKENKTGFGLSMDIPHFKCISVFLKYFSQLKPTIGDLSDLLSCYKCGLGDAVQTSNVHIHVVGDGKAGKTVAVKCLLKIFRQQYDDGGIDQRVYLHPDSRTRGIKSTTVLVRKQNRHFNYIVHDYGGQEEFQINHARYLSAENSIYILVLPLFKVADKEDQKEGEIPAEKIAKQYEYWAKFIYSVVNKDGGSKLGLQKSIPLITVLNKFSMKVDIKTKTINKIKDRLQLSLQYCNFVVAIINEDTDYMNAERYGDFLLSKIFEIDCTSSHGNLAVVLQLDAFTKLLYSPDRTFINGYNYIPSLVLSLINKLEAINSKDIPLLVTDKQFNEQILSLWMTEYFHNNVAKFSSLSKEVKQFVYGSFYRYCKDKLASIKRIYILPKPLEGGYTIITNPSKMTSSVMGDLLYWYTKMCPPNNRFDKEQLFLSNEKIIKYLLQVHDHRQETLKDLQDLQDKSIQKLSTKYTDDGIETAIEVLLNHVQTLPLCDLLVTMGLCVEQKRQTTNSNHEALVSKEVIASSWLVGLAKKFNHHADTLLDPSNAQRILHRVFVLREPSKAFFMPGYFTRLFSFMSFLPKSMQIEEIWSDALKMKSISLDMEISYIVKPCSLNTLDNLTTEGFIVTIAGWYAKEDLLKNCEAIIWEHMSCIEVFLHFCMWGILLDEYCGNIAFVMSVTKARAGMLGLDDERDSVAKLYCNNLCCDNAYLIWTQNQLRNESNSYQNNFDDSFIKLCLNVTDANNDLQHRLQSRRDTHKYPLNDLTTFLQGIFVKNCLEKLRMDIVLNIVVEDIKKFLHCSTLTLAVVDELVGLDLDRNHFSRSLDENYTFINCVESYDGLKQYSLLKTPVITVVKKGGNCLYCVCMSCGNIPNVDGFLIPPAKKFPWYTVIWNCSLACCENQKDLSSMAVDISNGEFVSSALEAKSFYTSTFNRIGMQNLLTEYNASEEMTVKLKQLYNDTRAEKHICHEVKSVFAQQAPHEIVLSSDQVKAIQYVFKILTLPPSTTAVNNTSNNSSARSTTFTTTTTTTNDSSADRPFVGSDFLSQMYTKTGLHFIARARANEEAAWVCDKCKDDYYHTGRVLFTVKERETTSTTQ